MQCRPHSVQRLRSRHWRLAVTGAPWQFGLAETHQSLALNSLRSLDLYKIVPMTSGYRNLSLLLGSKLIEQTLED